MTSSCFTRTPAETLKQDSCRQPRAGRAPLGFTVSAPCGHAPFQAHIPPPMAGWHVVSCSLRSLGSISLVQSPASSQMPEFHPCTQGTSNIPAGFQKEGKTWTWQHWKGLLNTLAFFLPRSLLNSGPEEQGSSVWANSPLAAALEITWQWLEQYFRWDAQRKPSGKFLI